MKKRTILLAAMVLLAAAAVLYLLGVFDGPQADYMPYSQFVLKVEEGDVSRAGIRKDTVQFSLKSSGKSYYTDNPKNGNLIETLLLQEVKVTDETDDMVSYVFDMAFNVLFFGLILFGVYKLLQSYNKSFHVVKHTGVRFDQIAGMDNLKREMVHAVDILKNPQKFREAGIRQSKGIILEGLPGNGKTLFAKALAEEASCCFIATKGADFQSALMSVGAMKIRMLFSKARRHRPCIIFIDEFDSIGERRNYAGTGIDKENNRIITTMLNEMDGFSSNDGILVIAATNSYASLDPALIRPGRFDLKYNIGNPDAATRSQLIKLYTASKKLDPSISGDFLAAGFEGQSCAGIETLLNEASTIANLAGHEFITMEDILASSQKTNLKINIRRRG